MTTAKVAVITGTTSNLGINIAYRLIDELPSTTNLTLVVTSRTLPRAKECIDQINQYRIMRYPTREGQVEFEYVLVDFADMISIVSAYYELTQRFTKIDYLFVNAAQGVYDGIDWMEAFMEVFMNPVDAVTNPSYKKQRVGVRSEDGMGLVFQANVFGPYYFIHKLIPLLKDGGKIIWISSLMGLAKHLSFEDLQLVRSIASYEGSKRLVDLMHYGTYKTLKSDYGIEQYLVQPGIFTSFSFFQYLNYFTYYGMLMLFYIARWLGSPNHNILGYIAANAPVAAAISKDSQDQKYKIGSATTATGKAYIKYEEVDDSGAEDVVAYLDTLVKEWDDKLKDQITNSRQI
ncbi:3-keto-steroid reductase [Scheffersomyces spartinae]|uniref:3beta-hydroxysteroid 3-dehydrogenase n=1 Tax=Scheffersomyces spartinae TaxID=45513 RepID=A0A9P8AH70_9ASCO|nr:3-keto-steroid reductase [Scheffersomyces spartinae]KAG7192192.1 3-keto-steroid reductase [Scheffersomyces spartinae]